MTQSVESVYRLATAADWQRAVASSRYEGGALDRADGFIHLSTASQVVDTARVHYAGQADLVLLTIPVKAIADALRWEVSRGGARFPHLYRPLEVADVSRVAPVPLDAAGRHVFPPLD